MNKHAIILLLGALASTPAAADNNFQHLYREQERRQQQEQENRNYSGGCGIGCDMFRALVEQMVEEDRAKQLRLQQRRGY